MLIKRAKRRQVWTRLKTANHIGSEPTINNNSHNFYNNSIRLKISLWQQQTDFDSYGYFDIFLSQ